MRPNLCPKGNNLKKDFALKRKFLLGLPPLIFILSFSLAQPPEQTYIIKKGDCLWDIAFRFLGDPFKWSQIWHQNPYITNPDLIYPGNNLVIGGSGQPAGAETTPYSGGGASGLGQGAVSGGSSGQEEFSSETRQALEESEQKSGFGVSGKKSLLEGSMLSDTLFRLIMENRNYFTEEFLAKTAFLWFKKDEKGLVFPGNASLRKVSAEVLGKYETEVYQQFDDVIIEPFGAASYRVGDTVDIYHSDRMVLYQGRQANLVRRVAKAAIRSSKGKNFYATLFKLWDVIESGDRVDRETQFPSPAIDSLEDPPVAIKGSVFLLVENTVHSYPYHSFILDRGSKDGVVFGDLFAIAPKNNTIPDRPCAFACALNVGETSSTLVIERLFTTVEAGDIAVIVKRIKFKQ
ncbi:MAG TPA: LysM peptidoglycan-binding domain-containing protein [Chitinivibrionales bacterium]|nr:LysM peptidoglycan-binding domain-containing protein [Chitinivibrionales bacterium]